MGIQQRKAFSLMDAMTLKIQLHQDNFLIYFQNYQIKTFYSVSADFLPLINQKIATKMEQLECHCGENWKYRISLQYNTHTAVLKVANYITTLKVMQALVKILLCLSALIFEKRSRTNKLKKSSVTNNNRSSIIVKKLVKVSRFVDKICFLN